MYKIRQFIINTINGKGIIQNSKGITIVDNKELLEFFTKIDQEGILYVTDEIFEKEFSGEHVEVIDFLLQSDLIYRLPDPNFSIKQINVYTNNNDFKELISFINSDEVVLIEEEEYENLKQDSCLFIFLNRFIPSDLYKICDTIRNRKVKFCISFVYNSKIYISNLYQKDWYNPCPKCFFANIESSLRAYSQYEEGYSFQTIVDIIYSKEPRFELNAPISKVLLVTLLSEVFKMRLNDYNVLSTRVKEIDFNGNIKYDIATNFELCDCFEI
ncbi:MAG: McbB family protein [Streptococcus parasanguinis]|nr:McbB family protein [Streptococcus parasanguinis]